MYNFQIVALQPDSPDFGVAVKLLGAYMNFKETFVRNALDKPLTEMLEKIVEIKTGLSGVLLVSDDPNQPGIPDEVRAALAQLKSLEAEFEKEAEETWEKTLERAVKNFELNFPHLLDSFIVETQQTLRDELEVTA
jgi:hypothetical protein